MTGQDVELRGVSIRPKGPGLGSLCDYGLGSFPTIGNGDKANCTASGTTKRWQRRVTVQFFCKGSNIVGTMTYPRNGGWFDRKYLENNSNRYKVAIKKNDC